MKKEIKQIVALLEERDPERLLGVGMRINIAEILYNDGYRKQDDVNSAEKDRDYWINEFNELEKENIKLRAVIKAIADCEALKLDNFGAVDFKRIMKKCGVEL